MTGSGQISPLQSIVLSGGEESFMAELLWRLIGIIVLRLGPQDLPAGASALVLSVVLYIAVTGLSLSLGETTGNGALVIVLAVVLPLVLVRIVLALRGRPARWLQTVTALFGTSALLSALALPLSALAGNGDPAVIPALASLALFAWSFAVDAHIWRHALDVAFVTGLAVAVVLFALSLFVISSLAGPF